MQPQLVSEGKNAKIDFFFMSAMFTEEECRRFISPALCPAQKSEQRDERYEMEKSSFSVKSRA